MNAKSQTTWCLNGTAAARGSTWPVGVRRGGGGTGEAGEAGVYVLT